MKNKIAFLAMRVSLGIVFLIFGIGKFKDDIWVETIRTMDFFIGLPWDVNISIALIGITEILTGAALIVGLFTRFFAAAAAAQLMGILILFKFQETRDIGLLGMAIYMAVVENDGFAIGWRWRKSKGGQDEKTF
ncbi:MAG: DoxX family protein [Candidatus Omnitrophica bacterium]|nr:DoxX family protein [Candidatus Omnitrophota bacterium]MBU4303213.1 DoxX family protein [Candidatus Omnitrophota bacterium]MBU4418589.1 DoxX family protein [Candidatus Omnitrophota bacterium]MBU4467531.1 DoxX family protein [Candidatus Omnitrophota bacterium]MCG2707466.1 DoxX family protein [Candidatus Omnitrophota bacterium]